MSPPEEEEYDEALVIEEAVEPVAPPRQREKEIQRLVEILQGTEQDPWKAEEEALFPKRQSIRIFLSASRGTGAEDVTQLVGRNLRDEVKADLAVQSGIVRHRVELLGKDLSEEIRAVGLSTKTNIRDELEASIESQRENALTLGVTVGGFLLLAVGLQSSSFYLGLAGFVLVALSFIHLIPIGNSGD